MKGQFGKYKSRKNKKRAIGSNQRGKETGGHVVMPNINTAVNPFVAALASMLSHSRGS